MEELLSWLESDNGFAVHVAVLVLLLLGGLGFPIPEDIPLLLAGVAAAKNIVDFFPIFLTCYSGVVIADQIIYLLGYLFGQRIIDGCIKTPLLPSVTQEQVTKVRDGLRKRRFFYIFVGRHVFPLRTATFLCAGALRIPFGEFFISDGIAAIISVSIVMGIGYWLGEKITRESAQHFVDQSHNYVIAAVVLVFAFYLGKKLLCKNKCCDEDSSVVECE